MNLDPYLRHTKMLAAPAAALVLAACGPSSESTPPPTPTIVTPPTTTPAVEVQTVFCDRPPGEGTPSAGPGRSAYHFITGSAARPGRSVAYLEASFGPPPPDAPPGTQANIGYGWDFPPDVPPPDPATIRERTSVRVNNVTYVMGVTATLRGDLPQLNSFCAPEGSPSIPPPIVTLTPEPPIATI